MRRLLKRMLHVSLVLVLAVAVAGCSQPVGGQSDEPPEIEPSEPALASYDTIGFWDFESDVSSPVGIRSTWELRHVERRNGVLNFEGIYDLSGDDEAEQGNVSIAGLDAEALTFAARFRLSEDSDSSSRPIPILVGGYSHRWLVVEVEQNELVIDLNNHDLRYPTGITVPTGVFAQFVVSIDTESGDLVVTLDGEPPHTIDLPASFEWNSSTDPFYGSYLAQLCVQDYSNGNAFFGDLDWVFVASGVLSPGEVKFLTDGGATESVLQDATNRDALLATELDRLENGATTHSYRAFADLFTKAAGMRSTVDTSRTSSSYISGIDEYRNFQPLSSTITTVADGTQYQGTSSGEISLDDTDADVWRMNSYKVQATGSAGESISMVLRNGGPGGDTVGEATHAFSGDFDGVLTLDPSMTDIPASSPLHISWDISTGADVRVNQLGSSSTTFLTMGDGVLDPVNPTDPPGVGWRFTWERIWERGLVAEVPFPRVPQRVYLSVEGETGDATFSLEDEHGRSTGVLAPEEVHNLTVDWAPTRLSIQQPESAASGMISYVVMWE